MTASTTIASANKIAEQPESFMERWLIMPKILYFLLNMYVYGFHSVMSYFFLQEWDLTYYMLGYASSVIVTNFFGAMVWTSLADKTGRYKTIIIASVIPYTVVALAILYPVFTDPSMWFYRNIYVFFGLALFNFFLSAAFPLLDAQVMGMMAANPKISKEQFNNQRMFGAIGHLFATLLTMILYERAGKDNRKIAQGIFQICVSLLFIFAVWLGVSDAKPVKGGHHGHHGGHKSADKETVATPKNPVMACLVNPSFMFFMLFVGASGVVRAITTSFQKPIALAMSNGKADKASYLDIGRTASEVGVYLIAKYIKNALGIYWVLAFSQLTGIARLWGYGLLEIQSKFAYWIACGLELLKGFNSGLISSSAIPIASNLAPAGCESTAQGLYSGNYSGLAMALGNILGGAIMHYLYTSRENQVKDAQIMFNWISWGGFVITLLLMAKFIFVDRVMGIPGFPRRHSFHK